MHAACLAAFFRTVPRVMADPSSALFLKASFRKASLLALSGSHCQGRTVQTLRSIILASLPSESTVSD